MKAMQGATKDVLAQIRQATTTDAEVTSIRTLAVAILDTLPKAPPSQLMMALMLAASAYGEAGASAGALVAATAGQGEGHGPA